MTKHLPLFFLFTFSLVVSCSDDDDMPEPDPCENISSVYEGEVEMIIAESCSYAGCHDGTGNNTAIPESANDFTSFAGLQSSLTSGAFNRRVIVQRTMPPAAFVPPGFPTELTESQLEILTCWRDAGFPEN